MPGIENISISTFAPSGGGWYTDLRVLSNTNVSPDMIVSMKPADTAYFSLYNLKLVAGRIYYPSDTMREFVVNEAVVRNLGIKNAQDAIGKKINVDGKICPIVGVVKDFHVNSLRDAIGPVVLMTLKESYGLANIKINLSQAQSVIKSMQNIWNANFPDYVFEYHFLDQTMADYYKQENQLSHLYKIFSGIAIFISCLGLYGFVAFMAVQRKKEIGIRKVLGAPVRDIVVMLSKEFTLLIRCSVSYCIADRMVLHASMVAAIYLSHYDQYLVFRRDYFMFVGYRVAYRGYTAIKAAIANPVKSLRTE